MGARSAVSASMNRLAIFVGSRPLEAILPGYLKRFRRTGEYNVRATS